MKILVPVIVGLLVILALGAASFAVYAYRPEIAALPADRQPVFDEATVARGKLLAAMGNCGSCHTTKDGKPFAGGVPLPTPFGTIHSTNITPDPQSGIGDWSEEAFARALHEGVDREGRHLYPVFPYDHFTHLTPEDTQALYAYLMAQAPVKADAPANDLPPPLRFRPLLAGWKLLFFDSRPLEPVQTESADWNRGYYLAEGLAHCGSCHTPRNAFGAEDKERHFAGAPIEGWYAYPIDRTNPAPKPWDVDTLAFYLANGFAEEHGVSRGPMAEVTANLRAAENSDVRALATYVVSRMGHETSPSANQTGETVALQELPDASKDAKPVPPAQPGDRGGAIYEAACDGCHQSRRPQPFAGIDLRKSTAVHADNPQNIVNMVLFGLPAAEGEPGPIMPGYAGTLSEADLVALLDYLRTAVADKPPWINARTIVANTMNGATRPAIYSSDGVRRAPVAGLPEKTP